MARIRILYQLNQLGFGGTEKAVRTLCQNLDTDQFEAHLFLPRFRPLKQWVDRVRALAGGHAAEKYRRRYVESRVRLPEFERILGAERIHEGSPEGFLDVMHRLKPNVVHFNRGSVRDWYTSLANRFPKGPRYFETNIFGTPADDAYLGRLDSVCFVSRWLLDKSPWSGSKGRVIYNPIKRPASPRSMRDRLGIPAGAFVLGRISRPDLNDDGFLAGVIARLAQGAVHMVIIGCPAGLRERLQGSANVHLIAPTTDETTLSEFYNTIDLLLHYRPEGETFGMNIAEAMLHGKPVISHRSSVDNAQCELLDPADFGPAGVVVPRIDLDAYCDAVDRLSRDPATCRAWGGNAMRKASAQYSEEVVASQWSALYQGPEANA